MPHKNASSNKLLKKIKKKHMISEFCETPTILILDDTSIPETTMKEL